MKRAKRILCGLLALTLTLSLLLVGTVTVAYAAKTAEQEAAEQEKAARMAALEQKKKEAENRVAFALQAGKYEDAKKYCQELETVIDAISGK